MHEGKSHDLGNSAIVDFGLRSAVYDPALYMQLKKIMFDYQAVKISKLP